MGVIPATRCKTSSASVALKCSRESADTWLAKANLIATCWWQAHSITQLDSLVTNILNLDVCFYVLCSCQIGAIKTLRHLCVHMLVEYESEASVTAIVNSRASSSQYSVDEDGLPTCMWSQAAMIARALSKSLEQLPKLEHLQLTLQHTVPSPPAFSALRSTPPDVRNERGVWPPLDWALPSSLSTLTSLHLAGLALGPDHIDTVRTYQAGSNCLHHFVAAYIKFL
jgi:hypothetical protein